MEKGKHKNDQTADKSEAKKKKNTLDSMGFFSKVDKCKYRNVSYVIKPRLEIKLLVCDGNINTIHSFVIDVPLLTRKTLNSTLANTTVTVTSTTTTAISATPITTTATASAVPGPSRTSFALTSRAAVVADDIHDDQDTGISALYSSTF